MRFCLFFFFLIHENIYIWGADVSFFTFFPAYGVGILKTQVSNESYKYSSSFFFSVIYLYTSYLCVEFKMLREKLCMVYRQNIVSEPPG